MVWVMKAVVAEGDYPMAAFWHWREAAACIGPCFESRIEKRRRLVIAWERIHMVFYEYGRLRNRLTVVRGAHADFSG